MRRLEYHIGDRYGSRTIIGHAESRIYKSGARAAYVRVRCDCGKEDNVRVDVLLKGRANMCKECSAVSKAKWGGTVYKAKWYHCWNGMMQRCYNPNTKRFYDYGGRGIAVCDAWHDPREFGKWAETHGYSSGIQLDRIDNDGNYCPENCRFVTPKENMQNRRNTVFLVIGDVSKSINIWCEEYGVSRDIVQSYHARKNLSWEDAFFLALGRKTCKEYSYGERSKS